MSISQLIEEVRRSNKLLLDAAEASKRLSICEKTLWTFTKDGSIPYVKIGRRVLYDPADLKAWIDANKQTAVKEGV